MVGAIEGLVADLTNHLNWLALVLKGGRSVVTMSTRATLLTRSGQRMSNALSLVGLGASLFGAGVSFFYADRSKRAGQAAAVAAKRARERLWLGRLVSQVHRFDRQIVVLDTIGRGGQEAGVALLRQLRHEAGELRGLIAKNDVVPARVKLGVTLAVAQLGESYDYALSVDPEAGWFPEEALRAAGSASMSLTEWIATESISLGGRENEL